MDVRTSFQFDTQPVVQKRSIVDLSADKQVDDARPMCDASHASISRVYHPSQRCRLLSVFFALERVIINEKTRIDDSQQLAVPVWHPPTGGEPSGAGHHSGVLSEVAARVRFHRT